MRAVTKKLKSRRGVTIIMAMVFFLVCAVIGSIVLATAGTNAGRLSHMRSGQQAHLTVSSAAGLVRDEITGMIFVEVKESPSEYFTGEGYSQTARNDSVLSDIFNQITKSFLGTGSFATESFTISAEGLGEVTATVTAGARGADNKFPVMIALKNADEKNPYEMLVTVTGIIETNPSTRTVTESRYVDDGENEPYYEPYDITISVTTTTFTYGKGIITVGGAK